MTQLIAQIRRVGREVPDARGLIATECTRLVALTGQETLPDNTFDRAGVLKLRGWVHLDGNAALGIADSSAELRSDKGPSEPTHALHEILNPDGDRTLIAARIITPARPSVDRRGVDVKAAREVHGIKLDWEVTVRPGLAELPDLHSVGVAQRPEESVHLQPSVRWLDQKLGRGRLTKRESCVQMRRR